MHSQREVLKATMVGVVSKRIVSLFEKHTENIDITDVTRDKLMSGGIWGYALCRVYEENSELKTEFKIVTVEQLKDAMSKHLIEISNLIYISSQDRIDLLTSERKQSDGYRKYNYFKSDGTLVIKSEYITYLGGIYETRGIQDRVQTHVIYHQFGKNIHIEEVQNLKDKYWTNAQWRTLAGRGYIRPNKELFIQERRLPPRPKAGSIEEGLELLCGDITLEQFKDICTQYGLNGFDWGRNEPYAFYSIDKRCKKLKMPDGCTLQLEYFNGVLQVPKEIQGTAMDPLIGQYALEELIIDSNQYYDILDNFLDLAPNFNKITFKSQSKKVSLLALRDKGRKFKVELPKDIEVLCDYEPNSAEIDFSKYTKLSILYKSMHSSKLPDNLELPSVRSIEYCFNNVSSMGELKLPAGLKSLSGFNYCEFEGLNFPPDGSLKEIGMASFRYCKSKFNKLTLPEGLCKIDSGSFSKWEDLQELILPSTLIAIGSNCFKDTSIKEIKLPERLGSIGELNPNINYEYMNSSRIPSLMCNNITVNNFKIQDTVTVIGRGAFAGSRGCINIPSKLRIISSQAFLSFQPSDDMKILDLSECSDLKQIEESAFENSHFHGVMLPDGVEALDIRSFRGMSQLRWIYIPSSVSFIGRSVLQNSGGAYRLCVYTQRGSKIDKYCSKNSDIHLKYVSSIDDVWKDLGMDAASKRKLSKLKMVIGGATQHSELFNARYEGKTVQLHDLYTTSQMVINNLDIKLNESSFKRTRRSLLDILPFDNAKQKLDEGLQNSVQVCNINQLYGYINILTHIMTSNNELLDIEVAKRFYSNEREISFVSYGARYNNSFVVTIDTKYKEIEHRVVYIQINGEVRWAALIQSNNNHIIFPYISKGSTEVHGFVETKFEENSECPVCNSVSSSIMPTYISKAVESVTYEQYVLLAVINNSRSAPKVFSKYQEYEVFLYSTVSENIIMGTMTLTTLDEISIDTISFFKFKGYKKYTQLTPGEIQKIKKAAFDQSSSDKALLKSIEGDSYIAKLCKSPNAYDKPIPCFEWELSDALQQMGITKPSNLNKRALDLILQTIWFKSGNIKLNSGRTKVSERYSEKILIENGRYTILTMRLKKEKNDILTLCGNTGLRYAVVIIDAAEKKSETTQIWYCSDIFSKIYNKLYKLSDKSKHKHLYLDNEVIDVSEDFILLDNMITHKYFGASTPRVIQLELAVSRATGIPFIIAGAPELSIYNEYKYIKLFRYRNLTEALREYQRFRELSSNDRYGIRIKSYDLVKLIYEVLYKTEDLKDNKLFEIRKAILNGAPNDLDIGLTCQVIYDSIAKQPRIQ